jgi:sulfur carrier protein ThiS
MEYPSHLRYENCLILSEQGHENSTGYLRAEEPNLRNLMRITLPDQTVRILKMSPAPIEQILLQMGISPAGVIVIKNGRIVPEDIIAGDNDDIRIIQVSHGG